MILTETNLANSMPDHIELKNRQGEVLDNIHSFDQIFEQIMKKGMPRTVDPDVEKWFRANFKNWLKSGATGYERIGNSPEPKDFMVKFYPSIEKIIRTLAKYHPEDTTYEELIAQFPPFVQKNPDGFELFCAGRLLGFKSLEGFIHELTDYLNAVIMYKETPNYTLMPQEYMVNNLSKLSVPNAIAASNAWHTYTKRQGEKIDAEKMAHLMNSLKEGRDYEPMGKYDTVAVLKLLSPSAVEFEGKAMKHCVGTYANRVASGHVVIYSVRDVETGLPVATFELDPDGKIANQLKGKYNGRVDPRYHKDIKQFIKDHDIKLRHDADKIS